MAAPWVAGAQARIIGRIHGQTTVNVLHFATNTQVNDQGALDTELLALAAALLECVMAALLAVVTQDWEVIQCDAKRIYPAPSDPILATAVPGSNGALATTNVSFASSLVNIRTGGGGRRGRGKMFLPPAGDANMTNSVLDAGTVTGVEAFLECLAGKFMGVNKTTNWSLGILSTTNLKGVGGTFDNSFREATSLNPKADVACIRSRKVGHGA